MAAAVLSSVTIILFSFVTAFASPSSENGNVLTVGVLTDRCPVFYCENGSEEIVGIGVDLMRFCAENAGYTVTFRQIEEKSLKDAGFFNIKIETVNDDKVQAEYVISQNYKKGDKLELVDEIEATHVGCEYGEYGEE